MLNAAFGAAGVVGLYLVYIGVTQGVPAVWAKLKAWWTAGEADLAAAKTDIAALKTDVSALKSKVGI